MLSADHPRQADHEADGSGGRKRPPSPPHEQHRRDRQRPELQHHRRPEGDAAAHVVPAFDERDTPRRERDRHEVEPLIQERQQRHAQHQIDRSRSSTPSPPHGRGRGQIRDERDERQPDRRGLGTAPADQLHREVLREHVFDGEIAIRRAGRGGDLLDPEHVDVGDGFSGHLSDRVPEDREADRDQDEEDDRWNPHEESKARTPGRMGHDGRNRIGSRCR